MQSTMETSTAMERRFEEYVCELGTVVGNDARRRGLEDYVGGLLLPGGRKSMEPIAERLDPDHVSRRHQSIQHFVSEARWSDAAVRERVRAEVIPALRARAPIEHLIIDDTTLLKSGRHSVGVAVQYCGRIHATANCQTLVSLSLSNGHDSLPVACDLYLPESWAHDPRRRLHAGVPPAVRFRTKPEIALDQLGWAVAAGLPGRIVLMDAAYGGDRAMRGGVRELGLDYAAAVPRDLLAAPVGSGVPAELRRGRRGEARAGAARVDVLARDLGPGDWQTVDWRGGAAGMLGGRFAARRVRTAPSDAPGWLGPEEWLLIEDADEPGDRSHWLISLPADTPLADLVRHAKGRWRVEQDYRDLKQEVGLGHFEGRSWRGLNHHVTLCLAAYGFLVRERSLFPPRHPGPQLPGNQHPGPPGPP
jgi:SRSO17 transposase